MLFNTFSHIPNIKKMKEKYYWDNGITSWNIVRDNRFNNISEREKIYLLKNIKISFMKYEENDIDFFFENIDRKDYWRLFKEFEHEIAYLDIETTGLSGKFDSITTISIFYKDKIEVFVKNKNLYDFLSFIKKPKILVTFNGNRFDIPFIEQYFDIKLFNKKIDLRYTLKDIGYTGGLKRCEKKFGINRGDLEGIDGKFAIYLWREYKENNNIKALNTLISYNISDTINLKKLAILSYNKNIEILNRDFKKMTLPEEIDIPFIPNKKVIEKIKRKYYNY